MKYKVGFVVHPRFQLQHIAGPMAAFESVGAFGETPYQTDVYSIDGGYIASSAGPRIETLAFEDADQLDILFISGGFSALAAEKAPEIAEFVSSQAAGCRHIATVASGANVLAASGLLDDRRVLTHWSLNHELAARYPKIKVQTDQFILRDDKFWTSSSISGGIEIARLIISEDVGKTASRRATRDLLNYYHRPSDGGEVHGETDQRFDELLKWVRANLATPLTIEQLAEQIHMHPRHFTPAFATATGQTPAKAVERMRLEAGYVLIENSDLPISEIAKKVGFMNSDRMRQAFTRAFGVPPQQLRDLLRQREQLGQHPPAG